ncbi:uncharacterized protein YALI1_B19453g [Yarrowia lipolytica]|uniref:Uncharacterized protein n=1 Tax=Yarrowia lipolytica TaxID=4952 RepID=A0A1D8N7V3_YARLL|nr:hypothetical protein YALI1_B19453g [Yarrowia lipolytica]
MVIKEPYRQIDYVWGGRRSDEGVLSALLRCLMCKLVSLGSHMSHVSHVSRLISRLTLIPSFSPPPTFDFPPASLMLVS